MKCRKNSNTEGCLFSNNRVGRKRLKSGLSRFLSGALLLTPLAAGAYDANFEGLPPGDANTLIPTYYPGLTIRGGIPWGGEVIGETPVTGVDDLPPGHGRFATLSGNVFELAQQGTGFLQFEFSQDSHSIGFRMARPLTEAWPSTIYLACYDSQGVHRLDMQVASAPDEGNPMTGYGEDVIYLDWRSSGVASPPCRKVTVCDHQPVTGFGICGYDQNTGTPSLGIFAIDDVEVLLQDGSRVTMDFESLSPGDGPSVVNTHYPDVMLDDVTGLAVTDAGAPVGPLQDYFQYGWGQRTFYQGFQSWGDTASWAGEYAFIFDQPQKFIAFEFMVPPGRTEGLAWACVSSGNVILNS